MLKAAKPSFKHVAWNTKTCFNAKVDEGANLSNAWHYHPEIELILIKESEGTRIIGTSVETFHHHDLVLIGKNLPHAFLHEELQAEQYSNPRALVIQFNENFLGNDFLSLPDLKEIQLLLATAKNGLCASENSKKILIPAIEKIFTASSIDRVILLLEILKTLTAPDACRVLVAEEAIQQLGNDNNRINKVLEYTYENFDEHIKIDDVAKLANLTKESFCRYFKSHTRKTYMEFLTGFRINKACALIRENQKSIKEIGYSCGFDSLSNFYYQFKKIVKLSPLDYKNQQL